MTTPPTIQDDAPFSEQQWRDITQVFSLHPGNRCTAIRAAVRRALELQQPLLDVVGAEYWHKRFNEVTAECERWDATYSDMVKQRDAAVKRAVEAEAYANSIRGMNLTQPTPASVPSVEELDAIYVDAYLLNKTAEKNNARLAGLKAVRDAVLAASPSPWIPVSEPPTEADKDEKDCVFWAFADGSCGRFRWDFIPSVSMTTHWMRIPHLPKEPAQVAAQTAEVKPPAPVEFIPLGPEDCPPGSVFKTADAPGYSWAAPSQVEERGLCFWSYTDFGSSGEHWHVSWEKLMKDYLILRPGSTWQPARKAKP